MHTIHKIIKLIKCFLLEYVVNSIIPHCPIWCIRRFVLKSLRTKMGDGSFIMRKCYIMNTNLLEIGMNSHINRVCLIDAGGEILNYKCNGWMPFT